MHDVAVIDYGVGNLLSVSRALSHCGADVVVTSDPNAIMAAKRVVLPGVGAFAKGMQALVEHRLDSVVHDFAASGKPLLGICLGMQMLMESSEEFGQTRGLSLIPGRVIQVNDRTVDGTIQKIPHIGWSGLVPGSAARWDHTLLNQVSPGESVYFVHSFMAHPTDPSDRVADCMYGGNRVTAVVQRKNVAGCQFHPEKSGEVGLRILKTFLQA
jgi:glutamine amidotransferase